MRSCIAFIFFFCWFNTHAQLPREIKFTNYTSVNGLPEETINNIIQDSRGFLWIGTREGLIRFDGRNYKTWYADPSDSTRFANNTISVIGEYEQGKVLFLSGGKLWSINIYNHRLKLVDRFRQKTIQLAPQRFANGQWVINDPDSIYITDNNFTVMHKIPIKKYFPSFSASGFYLQHPYVLLYGNGVQQFYIMNYTNGELNKITIDDRQLDVRSRYMLPTAYDSISQRLYLSSYFNGNFYIDLQIPSQTTYNAVALSSQPDGAIRRSLLLADNKLMVQAGVNGLYFTDFTGSSYFNKSSQADKPVVSDVMLDIYKTADGDFWLSTTNGISRFTLKQPLVKYWKQPDADPKDEIKRIFKASDGNIYFLRQNKSLFILSKDKLSAQRLDSSVYYCWAAVSSGDEIFITGAGKRIASYNIYTKKVSFPGFLSSFYSPNTDLVTLAYQAKNGDRWFSCNGSVGLIRNPAGTEQHIHYSRNNNPPSFSHTYVHSVAEDSHGNIWWGSNKTQMLLKWDAAQQQFIETGVDQLIPQQKMRTGINNLYVDKANNLWIAMDAAALLKYNVDTHSGSYYDINKGMPTEAVLGMCSDSKDRLWFTTRKGLCCYLPEKDKIVTFTSSDGLPEDNFEDDGIYYDPADNLLYAGGNHTIAYFNPDTLLYHSIINVPPVYIDEMLVNGKIFYFEDEKNIHLKTKENNIEFSFSSPDLNRNDQLIFQYRLKGAGNDWIDLGDKRSITFNGLNYGKYTLSVRCTYKGTDTWRETTQPFTFTIKTPLQKQLWFRSLLFALAALVILFIIRNYYRRKLEKQKLAAEKIQAIEKERTRIATDMHDDFGANLSRIKFISEKMQLTQADNKALTGDLTKISDYSDEMAEKMNEIVWALNQRYDSLEDLVSFCRSYASEYLQDKNILLHFSTTGISERMIQGETRRNIFLVIKEALHNVVKHSGASEVSISFRHDKDLEVTIADNGRGFSAGSIHAFANGLENMKKRMADINGKILIESEKGTRISISAPI